MQNSAIAIATDPHQRAPMRTVPRRTFVLHRRKDYSGVSGTGVIAEGAVFGDGAVVLHWLGAFPTTTVFASLVQLVRVHGHGGSTRVVFDVASSTASVES